MSVSRAALLSFASLFVLAACSAPTPSDAELAAQIEEAVRGTVEAQASALPMTATPAPSHTPPTVHTPVPTSTFTPTTTATPAPTSLPPAASVSLVTNCRTGPGSAYPIVLSLKPGQVAQVTARSTVENYWYIANPDQSNEYCWLWGEYATVEGDASNLPVLTPPPAPTPQFVFSLYRHSFTECGVTRVVLVVVNKSGSTFRSARIHVEDLDTSDDLHGPRLDLEPFGDNPSSCPADKGSNSLPPGATAYLVIPISPFEGGHDAVAHIKLCTGDDGGGDCVTKSAYFRLPDE